jgi:hypothetical protein
LITTVLQLSIKISMKIFQKVNLNQNTTEKISVPKTQQNQRKPSFSLKKYRKCPINSTNSLY